MSDIGGGSYNYFTGVKTIQILFFVKIALEKRKSYLYITCSPTPRTVIPSVEK